MNRYTYNFDALNLYINENNITLNNDYSEQKITRDTIIEGKCIQHNCSNNFKKNFRQLKITGGLCYDCCKIKQKEKTKKIFLEKYGYENPFNSPEIISKIKQTNIIKYGCENPLQTEEIKQKRMNTCLEKYGVKYQIKSKKTREKIKQTNLQKYGVENPGQSKEIKQKIKETNIQKYGFECVFQSEEIKNKSKTTCLKNYGVEHSMQSFDVRKKAINSCINKYGFEHPTKSAEIKEKIKKTNLHKYGVENTHQVPEIAEKASLNSYRKKTYIFPSGKEISCQGYEPLALDKLIKQDNILEEDIVTGCKNVPTIWYNDTQNKKHRHYVDIFIPSQNRCVEVKSTWTAEKKKDNIFFKQEAAKQLGYNYEIWIYNAKKELVEIKK